MSADSALLLEAARGLRPDRQHDLRRARRARRLDRLAVLAAFRLGRLLRGAARRPRARPLADCARGRARASVAPRICPARPCSRRASRTTRGRSTLTDFMPLTEDEDKVDVVRIVRGVRGEMSMRMELILRFDYGRAVPWVRRRDYGLSAIAGPDAVELHTDVAARGPRLQDSRRVHGARRATACRSRCRITARTSRRISCRIAPRAMDRR